MRPFKRAFVKAAHAAVTLMICMVVSGGAANAIAPGATPSFAVLGPLLMSSQQEMDDFDAMVSEAKAIGVQRVSIDVWWGIVQPISADDYDWSYVLAEIPSAAVGCCSARHQLVLIGVDHPRDPVPAAPQGGRKEALGGLIFVDRVRSMK